MNTRNNGSHQPPTSIEKRLRRIESRLVQLMLHMGLNPYSKQYEGDEVPAEKREKENERDGDQ